MQGGIIPNVIDILYMPRTIIIKAKLHFIYKKKCKYLHFWKIQDT